MSQATEQTVQNVQQAVQTTPQKPHEAEGMEREKFVQDIVLPEFTSWAEHLSNVTPEQKQIHQNEADRKPEEFQARVRQIE